jgi:hypothetical protein
MVLGSDCTSQTIELDTLGFLKLLSWVGVVILMYTMIKTLCDRLSPFAVQPFGYLI